MKRLRSVSVIRHSLIFLGISLSSACAPGDGEDDGAAGDIGAPCELEEHCASGLICDTHDGQGSCQEDHDH